MPHDTHLRGYPDPETVATYSFWGFYVKMTDACNLATSEKLAAPGVKAFQIIKRRKRQGLLSVGDHGLNQAAVDLPIKMWSRFEREHRLRCLDEVIRTADHSMCCSFSFLGLRHEDHYKSWCSLCWPQPPNPMPENPFNENLVSAARTPTTLKRTFCDCLVCDQDPIIHLPGRGCPTARASEFQFTMFAQFGLRIVCIISDEEVGLLFGITRARFPDVDLELEIAMHTREIRRIRLEAASRHSGDAVRNADGSGEAGEAPAASEEVRPAPAPEAVPQSASDDGATSSTFSSCAVDPNRRLTKRQLATLEAPFRRLLRAYPNFEPFYLDPKESPNDPEVFCEYHTPLVPSYWSSADVSEERSDLGREESDGDEGYMPGSDGGSSGDGEDDGEALDLGHSDSEEPLPVPGEVTEGPEAGSDNANDGPQPRHRRINRQFPLTLSNEERQGQFSWNSEEEAEAADRLQRMGNSVSSVEREDEGVALMGEVDEGIAMSDYEMEPTGLTVVVEEAEEGL